MNLKEKTQKSLLIRLFRLMVKVLGLDMNEFNKRLTEIEDHPERFNEKAAKITDEYREIKWLPDESPRMYSLRVLGTMLPTFKNRDEALDALALVYPFVSKENALMKISAALYFTRSEHAKAPTYSDSKRVN